MTSRLSFLGLDFDALDASEAAQAIAAKARRRDAFAYVATPNVDHVVRMERAPELASLYRSAWLNLCDSRVLELMARMSGMRLPAAPGADVVERLVEDHIDPGETVVVVGGAIATIHALRAQFALTDIRWHAPPAGLRDDAAARAACVDFILANPAPFIFLAVGSPQQEMIARETLARGGATGVAICCGASLAFLSGEVTRAPRVIRAARAEWLWRLGAEPGRLWRRYLVDGPRVLGVWRRWAARPR